MRTLATVVTVLACLAAVGCGAPSSASPARTETAPSDRALVAHYVAPGWDETDQAGEGDFDTNLLLGVLADTSAVSACTAAEPTSIVLDVVVSEAGSTMTASSTRDEDRALAACVADGFRDRVAVLTDEGGSVRFTLRVSFQLEHAP
ncbi:MAG: hypothetical protein K1X94_15715 [Sandaracinaceae bacterium]|nr:hypothetical protein [Sandaracinaceae bacterium]